MKPNGNSSEGSARHVRQWRAPGAVWVGARGRGGGPGAASRPPPCPALSPLPEQAPTAPAAGLGSGAATGSCHERQPAAAPAVVRGGVPLGCPRPVGSWRGPIRFRWAARRVGSVWPASGPEEAEGPLPLSPGEAATTPPQDAGGEAGAGRPGGGRLFFRGCPAVAWPGEAAGNAREHCGCRGVAGGGRRVAGRGEGGGPEHSEPTTGSCKPRAPGVCPRPLVRWAAVASWRRCVMFVVDLFVADRPT
jgi:translation initiation factor IF-2